MTTQTTASVPPDGFTRFFMSVMAGLLALGVAGLWNLSTNVARLEERLASATVSNDRSIAHLEAKVGEHGRRLYALEMASSRRDNDDHNPWTPNKPENRFAIPPNDRDKRRQ